MPPVKKPKNKPTPKKSEVEEESTPVVSGQLQKKLEKREKRQKPQRGVVFIKHLPHGFFENQIRRYFEQFGNVTRLRLVRSKRTGGSKGFAFVEFEVPDVAEVAAETMDNYLMFNKVVKATYIPPEKQFYNFFKTSVRKVKNKAGKPIYISYKTADINRRVKKFNEWSDEAYQKRTAIKQKRIQKLNEKYAHLGIDFSTVVVGSKESDETAENGVPKKKSTNETEKKIKASSKSSKDKVDKKSKKLIELEDLLGTTLDDNDSDDHDFELESESGDSEVESDDADDHESDEDVDETEPKPKKKRTESVNLEDLLGDTLNEDSDDDEFEVNAADSEQDEESSDDEDEEEETPKKVKPAIKKTKKVNKPKVDHLDELVKHKKLTGGIHKPNKVPKSKKTKVDKPKNDMKAALVKQMARALAPNKKTAKQQSKKQKK